MKRFIEGECSTQAALIPNGLMTISLKATQFVLLTSLSMNIL